jgi:hypothetical protein
LRAHTATTKYRTRGEARRFVLVLALAVSALTVPVSASGSPVDAPPASERGSPSGLGDSSLNGEPTLVSDSPAATGDGFDWASAAVGAGAVLALLAFGGAALLTAKNR